MENNFLKNPTGRPLPASLLKVILDIGYYTGMCSYRFQYDEEQQYFKIKTNKFQTLITIFIFIIRTINTGFLSLQRVVVQPNVIVSYFMFTRFIFLNILSISFFYTFQVNYRKCQRIFLELQKFQCDLDFGHSLLIVSFIATYILCTL